MKENEYKVAGYSFSDVHDYKEAKREAETIDYIRANTDLKDLNKMIKLYHKLVERKTLKTVIGFSFLKELQERILKEGIVNKESMPCIPIEKDTKHLSAFSNPLEHDQVQKHQAIVENYRIGLRNSRIISAFLVGIIIFMIVISIWSDRNIFSNYENEILDKYSTWEEDLNTREQLLDTREEELQSVE
jgi:hypothetical protein